MTFAASRARRRNAAIFAAAGVVVCSCNGGQTSTETEPQALSAPTMRTIGDVTYQIDKAFLPRGAGHTLWFDTLYCSDLPGLLPRPQPITKAWRLSKNCSAITVSFRERAPDSFFSQDHFFQMRGIAQYINSETGVTYYAFPGNPNGRYLSFRNGKTVIALNCGYEVCSGRFRMADGNTARILFPYRQISSVWHIEKLINNFAEHAAVK